MRFALAWMAALTFAVSGCASLAQPPWADDEAALLERRGAPTRVWPGEGGNRVLEYTTQPSGRSNWMIEVDTGGRIVGHHDALTRDNLQRVREGMTLEAVQRLLGQHRRVTRYRLSGEEVWDWNVENVDPGVIATYFNVHFVDHRVVRTSFSYEYPNANDGDRAQ